MDTLQKTQDDLQQKQTAKLDRRSVFLVISGLPWNLQELPFS